MTPALLFKRHHHRTRRVRLWLAFRFYVFTARLGAGLATLGFLLTTATFWLGRRFRRIRIFDFFEKPGRRINVVFLRPSQLFSVRMTAATRPALFCVSTAAAFGLARERN